MGPPASFSAHEPEACVSRPRGMTADAKIVRAAWIAFALGWSAFALAHWLDGHGPVVEWSLPVLIGLTIGLASRWLSDRLGVR
jgi:hypothetical protein